MRDAKGRPGAAAGITRRLAVSGVLGLPLAACGGDAPWHDIDVTGTSPSLRFALEEAPSGRTVTEADFRGALTMLYFGYTSCPDVCPLTLQNASAALARAGAAARGTKFLFVTVDPGRDTLPALAQYTALFGSAFVGLRGTPDQLARLARRFRIAYSVTPATATAPEAVTHTSIVYVFDRRGDARLIVPSLATATPDIAGVGADLARLARAPGGDMSWFDRFV